MGGKVPRHRSLTLKKFVTAVNKPNPQLLEEYFSRLIGHDRIPPHLSIMYYDYVENLLNSLGDERLKAVVFEDFRRINDICEQQAGGLVWASKKFDIPQLENETPQALGMRLFLNHPEAFEYAWARYCVFGSSTSISRHNIPCETLHLDGHRLEAFNEEVKKYFASFAKGQDCRVQLYDEGDQVIILVTRGSYYKPFAHWEAGEVKVDPLRPAYEDMLVYEKKSRQLCLQTRLARDREQYIRSFASIIVGDPSLAERPDRDRVYTLAPFQDGTFSWDGNDYITFIVPVEAKLKVNGATEPIITVKSKDIRQTLQDQLKSVSLSSVNFIYIKLRFTLEVDGKAETVTFTISPPSATDLAKKRHADIISAYLKENGVQLI
jgi:hypothetical protein